MVITGIVAVFGIVGPTVGQPVPKAVQSIVDNYVADSTAECGLLFVQRFIGVDSTLRTKDIEVGTPLEQYSLRYDVLDTCGVDIPIGRLVMKSNLWILPIRAKGRYIYFVEISKASGAWRLVGTGELLKDNFWDQLRTKYPESSGVRPIIVVASGREFLHFPHLGDHNLYGLQSGVMPAPLTASSLEPTEPKADSRKVVAFLGHEWKSRVRMRAEEDRKAPNPIGTQGVTGGDQ